MQKIIKAQPTHLQGIRINLQIEKITKTITKNKLFKKNQQNDQAKDRVDKIPLKIHMRHFVDHQ